MKDGGKRLAKLMRFIIVWSLAVITLTTLYAEIERIGTLPYAKYILLCAIAVTTAIVAPLIFVGSNRAEKERLEQLSVVRAREYARAEVNAVFPTYEHLCEHMDYDASGLNTDGE